jgi:ribosomal protein L34E
MSLVYRCDECGAVDVPIWQEQIRYRPVGPDRLTRSEKVRGRGTGCHLCEPCIERLTPVRSSIRPKRTKD